MPSHSLPPSTLNPAQFAAAEYGSEALPGTLPGPLLVIAGAGTGKTKTLAHRVAHLVVRGADPARILLLTFTRRAAEIMTRRAEQIAHGKRVSWAGTFHAVANRLLRHNAAAVGLDPAFTVLDRSDSADLLNVIRNDLGLAKQAARFPKKETCLSIYSHAVNARQPVENTLRDAFPAYASWAEELKRLFTGYVDAKLRRHVLDYDDLLLYWFYLMSEDAPAESVRRRFDHVLVDEYQDTNAIQAGILLGLKPDGRGLTVVGDDAQSIYSFRAATVRNILDFPGHFDPPAHVVTLEQNYRSTRPILDAANAVIALASEAFPKRLFSERRCEQRPWLTSAKDEQAQAEYIVKRILELRESGIDLKRQAVLMRAAHHSDVLEVELARRNIPFVKFGGLKFLEAAHVKDVLCVLRWAENPRDEIAAFRVLQLLPGMGPAHARRLLDGFVTFDDFEQAQVPTASRAHFPGFCALLCGLRHATEWQGQFGMVRAWYRPHLERLYDVPQIRMADLEQLEQLAANHPSRENFLSDLTLDPPNALGDEAGDPLLDEDYLILSTIHSSKGQEWDAVYVLNVVDGCIPSDMATGNDAEIEEERRLLYVAMTRARDHLYLVQPHRFYTGSSFRNGDRHVYAPRTRFIPDSVLPLFERTVACATDAQDPPEPGRGVDVAAKLRELWS